MGPGWCGLTGQEDRDWSSGPPFLLHLMGGLLPPSGDLNFECSCFHLLSGSRPQPWLPRGPLGSQHVSLVDFLHVYFQGLFGLSDGWGPDPFYFCPGVVGRKDLG